MTCICVLTAFRPSFPHLETLKKNIGKLNSLTVRKKKKKKKKSRPTDPIFKFWSGEGNITIFFFGLTRKSGELKGEVQSRITIISKERVKISLQIGAKMRKIG